MLAMLGNISVVIFGEGGMFTFILLNIVGSVHARHVISGAIFGIIGWMVMGNLPDTVGWVQAVQVINSILGMVEWVISGKLCSLLDTVVIFGKGGVFTFILLNIVGCVQARHVISGAIFGIIGWVVMGNLLDTVG